MTEHEFVLNPFPGLRHFKIWEQHLFFGRESQSKDLLGRLRRNRMLAVVGTSGSGKSSLVRAGLLPLLYGGFMAAAGSAWRIAVTRPGNNPIRNLACDLNKLDVLDLERTDETEAKHETTKEEMTIDGQIKAALVEAVLRRSALGLIDFARQSKLGEHENLLVVVDQFEELFRFKNHKPESRTDDEAAAFVKLLLEATRDKERRIFVVLTMRSDFLGDCAQFRDLPEAVTHGQYLIPA